ncbi:MAG TPA: undecaprenyl-phosphate glucose phosphotransferase [Terriglobales bacterium]|nr:undecaprenyl-phosphate glucose phosphotransferase [Terriglobales bacterium]
MISRLNFYRFLMRAGCYSLPLFACAFGWCIASLLSQGRISLHYEEVTHYILLLLFMSLVWIIAAEASGVFRLEDFLRERTGLRQATRAWFTTCALVVCALLFSRQKDASRLFMATSALVLFCGTLALRAVLRFAILGTRRWSRQPARLLIVGADAVARRAAARLRQASFADCAIVGFIQIPGQRVKVRDAPVYQLDQLEALPLSIDDIIIALPPHLANRIPRIRQRLESLCRPIRAILDLGNVELNDRMFQFGGLHMLDLAVTPAETPSYNLLKRAFDLIFAALTIVLASPLFLLCAVAVKLTSRGPVLFKQDRVGLNGRVFSMYKFRTMKVATSSESDIKWTIENDPRRTIIGKFLRKTSLDELPQFFNVIQGRMSIVGPRPERPYFVKRFSAEYDRYSRRHLLKSGITGWAQVNGCRGDTSIRKRVEYDLDYLHNWSFWFDLRIIFQTLWITIGGRNAY